MITKIDDYFAKGCGRCERFATEDCSTRRWQKGLHELRRICLEAGLIEEVKWGHPCYMHAGRNLVVFGAFRDDFRLSFFYPALMKDPDGILEKQGPNTQHPDAIRFVDNDSVSKKKKLLLRYLREAMSYAQAGKVPPKIAVEIDLPEELVEALDADPELAEAFHRLTPGRQRSYVIHIGSAKKRETRVARVSKYRDRIVAGKGATER